MSLEFKRKVWPGDRDLGVFHIEMMFKAMRLDEMPKGESVDSEEKWHEDLSLRHSIVKRAGRWEESARH